MKKIVISVLFCLVFQSFVFAEESALLKQDFITPLLKGQVTRNRFEKYADSAPLVVAIIKNDKIMFDELMKDEAINVNQTYFKIPPTFIALCYGRYDMLNAMLDRGANPNASYIGCSLIYYAAARDEAAVVRNLKSHGADVDKPTYSLCKRSKNQALKDAIGSDLKETPKDVEPEKEIEDVPEVNSDEEAS